MTQHAPLASAQSRYVLSPFFRQRFSLIRVCARVAEEKGGGIAAPFSALVAGVDASLSVPCRFTYHTGVDSGRTSDDQRVCLPSGTRAGNPFLSSPLARRLRSPRFPLEVQDPGLKRRPHKVWGCFAV